MLWLLLNLIPGLLFAGFLAVLAAWYWERISERTTAVLMVVLLVLGLIGSMIQPSYMPKGEVPRASVPQFESRDSEVTNRERTHQERDAQELDHPQRIEDSK